MKKCVLEIVDEVNIRFHNLDITTRRKLVDAVKFFLPYARHTPAFKLGRWDGCIRYCDIGGRSYINLLDKLLPIVQQAGYDFEIVDQRPQYDFQFEAIDENSYEHIKWPEGHRYAGEPIKVMDHQIEAVNAYLENLQAVQSISTGAGKTLITGILSHKVEDYGRSIVVVPSKDLVTQTEDLYRTMGLDVGVFYGDRKEYNRTHTICTWQSLEILNKKSKDYDPDITIQDFIEDVVCIMIDECFDGSTPVLTPTGYVRIDSLKAGDEVINYSESSGEFKTDVVEQVHENLTKSQSEPMMELKFDDGTILQVTANHKFLTNKGWVRADELTSEDTIIQVNKT